MTHSDTFRRCRQSAVGAAAGIAADCGDTSGQKAAAYPAPPFYPSASGYSEPSAYHPAYCSPHPRKSELCYIYAIHFSATLMPCQL